MLELLSYNAHKWAVPHLRQRVGMEIGIRRPFAQPRSDLTSHPRVSQFQFTPYGSPIGVL